MNLFQPAFAYRVAGSADTYVRRSIDPPVGFLVGWAVLLGYLFLPMSSGSSAAPT